ncbi:UvrD-helicase domain-containing protein [Maridesulfovibrio hydrothermalis]|uniref:DNA 3'-5' helicase n=1 Tax=Maridesulfovibrio hydrothermalis AM13 = DSM 14728 TaxID=1121451 RepID=L0REV2_9BACT|nr:UvrD-helicase domain-containing protein [Maridesulfovibrio hydrothermalis]CCO24081.1 Exodeoxyribonuclease V [Maridesulfovibrio hydrothermalis AM13 = DSM 14728]
MLKQVKASAGSGKTYELTARFLSLLAGAQEENAIPVCKSSQGKGYCWPEIMAVTFTNKAAAEMKERVVRSLKNRALNIKGDGLGSDWSPHEAKRQLTPILQRYNRLNIRTIDSLLNLLVRIFALELGLSPEFELLFDPAALFEPNFNKFLAHCEEGDEVRKDLMDDAVNSLVLKENKQGFWLAEQMRFRLISILEHIIDNPAERMTDQEEIADLLQGTYDKFMKAVAAMSLLIETDKLAASAHLKKYLDHASKLEFMGEAKESAMIAKESFKDCVNKKSKEAINSYHEKVYGELKEAHAKYRDEAMILRGAYALAPFVRIVEEIRADIIDYQTRNGMLLSTDLPKVASFVLQGGTALPDAFCRMGSRLHHLLIDEFQDTSLVQWNAMVPLAVECLSKRGSLFYVGDVKQAIYSWRGGRSELFDDIGHDPEIANLSEFTPGNLEYNWRSLEHVVEFNNNFFDALADYDLAMDLSEILYPNGPEEQQIDLAQKIATSFELASQKLPPNQDRTGGYVRLKKVFAATTQEIVDETKCNFDQLMDELLPRRDYKDICVLVRSNGHAQLVCDWLVEKSIPVITENSLQLDRHPVVRQMVSLLKFLDYPQDDLAFLEFICGKEIFQTISSISHEELIKWLAERDKGPLYRRFAEKYPDFWGEHISPFLRKSGLMTPYDLASEIVNRFNLIESNPQDELYIRRFLEVVHLAEEKRGTSLAAFLDFWELSSAEEKVPLPESVNAVRIMTIHKSKGLEFPVIIVPFHNWAVSGSDTTFTDIEINGNLMLTPMSSALGDVYYENRTRIFAEQLNLLYVAWTRAGEELYGFLPSEKVKNITPALSAIETILEGRFDDNGLLEHGECPEIVDPEKSPQKTDAEFSQPENKCSSDSEELLQTPELMGWLPRLRVYRHNLEDYSYDARMRGELAHNAMENLILTGDDASDCRRSAEAAFAKFPAVTEEKETIVPEVTAMALWALTINEIRAAIEYGRPEVAIMDAKGETHRADLLLLEEKRALVVEYKTGKPSPDNEKQVKRYLKLLKEMYGDEKELRGLLVYLDGKFTKEVTL